LVKTLSELESSTQFLSMIPTMNRRLCFVLLFVSAACAQQFDQVVFPITDFKPDIRYPFTVKFGTGFCLDRECRFVGTNYHVAKVMGKRVRVKGVSSVHRYLDSGPDDAGAQEINFAGGNGALRYAPAHDLAIYEMQRPLRHVHGIGFDADVMENAMEKHLENNLEVDIYAYPFSGNPKRGLVCWHGRFVGKTTRGLLAFRYSESHMRAGASGGIVVDSRTQKIVGILSAIGEGVDRIALAVPVRELADFVARAQPYLQATLFPNSVFISPLAADLYPPYVQPHGEALAERPVEPPEVVKLRRTAQHLADAMDNFIATETFAWGHEDREPEAADAYETLIEDGEQRWRRLGDRKFYQNVPFPPLGAAIVPGAEWSELPRMVGIEFGLRIQQAPDAALGGRTIHVFQYAADAEDGVCRFRSVTNFGFFQRGPTRSYDCHGEVWTDESGVILRISEDLDLSGPWYRWRGVMTYGWLEKDGAQYRVPITITAQAEHGHTYWCRGLFTDYEMFSVKARLRLPEGQF
jgi:hypothetical protein